MDRTPINRLADALDEFDVQRHEAEIAQTLAEIRADRLLDRKRPPEKESAARRRSTGGEEQERRDDYTSAGGTQG